MGACGLKPQGASAWQPQEARVRRGGSLEMNAQGPKLLRACAQEPLGEASALCLEPLGEACPESPVDECTGTTRGEHPATGTTGRGGCSRAGTTRGGHSRIRTTGGSARE